MPITKAKKQTSAKSASLSLKKNMPAAVAEAKADESLQAAFDLMINENALLFFRMKLVAEEVHQQGELSGGKRSILRSLEEGGAQTVPQISRARSVTRQHVQTTINELVADGLVEFFENPAHKRSPFAQLTTKGQRFVTTMHRREAKFHEQMRLQVSESELRAAARTLQRVRAEFESDQWRRVLKQLR